MHSLTPEIPQRIHTSTGAQSNLGMFLIHSTDLNNIIIGVPSIPLFIITQYPSLFFTKNEWIVPWLKRDVSSNWRSNLINRLELD